MDITYRPYIRDSALKEVSFKSPVVSITGYTPKYTVDNIKEEPAQAVESQIEEIKSPKVHTSIPTISDKSINFKSKKEFKDTMTPLYESMLIKKGLNPAFAKALVAQDGLESAWGSRPAGNFNFGGIKGKGSVKKTREVIDGKDVYINDSFRDFNSLEDYVNYKIDLLNNNRYKAFSGDLKEFADRVHRGGYATDPNYSKVLNSIIASAKHGGVLKFQDGGLLEGKEWVKRWYRNRRPKIKQNIMQNQKIPVPVTGTFGYNVLAHNIDLTTAKIDPKKVPEDASGVYYPWGRRIFLKEDSASSAVHEWTHGSRPDPQVREIDKIKNVLGDTIYDQKSVIPDEYLDDSHEVYSRLMQLRHALGIDPNHEFTNEEIEALKKGHIKYQSLNSILRGNNKNKISTTIFDKDNNVIQAEPFSPEYKISSEESTSHTEYDNDKTFNLLNRYSTDFLRRILNDVAQVPSKKKEGTLYVQLGVKIPKYQGAGTILPNYTVQKNERKPNLSYPVKPEYGNYIPNSNYPDLDYYHKFGQTDNKFEEFVKVLKPIFTQVLKEKQLPLTQVNNLIRQAALESGYGLSPRGSKGFNLGGIKWTKKQQDREWTINPSDNIKYIDFENLYDYAQYKVDLLNSRYDALTATDINGFVNRLHGNNLTKSSYSDNKEGYKRTLNNTTSLNKYLGDD